MAGAPYVKDAALNVATRRSRTSARAARSTLPLGVVWCKCLSSRGAGVCFIVVGHTPKSAESHQCCCAQIDTNALLRHQLPACIWVIQSTGRARLHGTAGVHIHAHLASTLPAA